MENEREIAYVKQDRVCGSSVIRPNNSFTLMACELAQTKTLTDHVVRVLKARGHKIIIKQEEVTL